MTKYAVVNVLGRQFKVKEGDKIKTNLHSDAIGSKLSLGEVLMVSNGNDIKVGAPYVSGAKVTATVEGTTRADKILVFKYLRKNHLKKTRGHKQPHSILKIEKIEG